MSFLAIITGYLVQDVTMHDKNEKYFGRLVVCDNTQKNNKGEKIDFFVTCFDYSMSHKRAQKLRKGTHVLIRGSYSDKQVVNISSGKLEIERLMYVENLEILAFADDED